MQEITAKSKVHSVMIRRRFRRQSEDPEPKLKTTVTSTENSFKSNVPLPERLKKIEDTQFEQSENLEIIYHQHTVR